jgi:type I restriction enzyme S subunit
MQLLQHFKELTLRPKNAQELKGLILQLAIQGKLTANWRVENPEVEPASELLKRIQKEKEQLVKEKKINKEKSLSKLDKDEIPYDIPLKWTWCRLRESGFTQTGTTPPKKNPENYGDFIPFIGPADISNQSMEYPVSGLSKLGISVGRLIPRNSIMMVCIGGSIGKCNINEVDVSCNQQINTVTPVLIPAVYMKVNCQSPYFQKGVIDKASGSATPIINKGKWEMLPIPLPPLEEQKEIVKVVESLFKEVEQLEQLTQERISLKEDFVVSALNQLTTNNTQQEWSYLKDHFKAFFDEKGNIKKLRETILQLAVQGKLTRAFRESHPELVSGSHHASELLKRIQEEKAQLIKEKKIKKEKSLLKITDNEIPYELPDGWVWCRIRDVSYSIVPNRDKPKSFSGDITWLTTRNLEKQSNIIHPKASDNKLTIGEVENYNARLLPRYSVIMSCVGQFGLSAILDKEYSCNQQLHCFVPLGTVNPYYVDYLIKNGKEIYENMSSATTIAYLNKTKCDSLPISLPPLEEQKAIVQKVNALMEWCDALEQEVQHSQEHSEQLMQSVLREVFEGEKAVEV